MNSSTSNASEPSCDDHILTLLFVKYVSDKAKSDPNSLIDVPEGASFDDMFALDGTKEIGDKIIGKLGDELNATQLAHQDWTSSET